MESLVASEQHQEAVFHESGWSELSPDEEESILSEMFCNLTETERDDEIWDMALA